MNSEQAMANFKTKALWYMRNLIDDFQFLDFQAAGIMGNGYQESMLRAVLEADGIVTSPTRGIGWFQWTGPRHPDDRLHEGVRPLHGRYADRSRCRLALSLHRHSDHQRA